MYEMLNGKPLFNFYSSNININEYKKPITFGNNFSDEAKDLITKLLDLDPEKRIGAGRSGFENLKKHKYFEDINWDDLENKKIQAPFVPDLDNSTDLKYFDKIFTEETNITKEGEELNYSTNDNYTNFSFYDGNSASFKDKEKLEILKSKNKK